MSKNITKIKKIKINSFRALENITLDFADRVTLICGKNGLSKSSILGIIAQCFSFRTDYTQNPPDKTLSEFKTLTGKPFESYFSEHFRFSEKYDIAKNYDIELEVYDGAEQITLDNLKLRFHDSVDRKKIRPVVRNNSKTHNPNTSRNVTHPLIYLSMKRLLPITEREYDITSNEYFKNHHIEFQQLNNNLLCRIKKNAGTNVAVTKGTVPSAVVHGNNYDHESVSTGDDNSGQILQALFSFKRLKEIYPNYHGGIILIDEADAALFPSAQEKLFEILQRECKKYNLQVILTSHSPTLINKVWRASQRDNANYKVLYLSNGYGDITCQENLSWSEIVDDLHEERVTITKDIETPQVNIYFEDQEAIDFYKAMITSRTINKLVKIVPVKLGSTEYLRMVEVGIKEFSQNSIICFDSDVKIPAKLSKHQNLLKLPGSLPPDQLIFEFLYNLPENDSWLKNNKTDQRRIFKHADTLLNKLNITDIANLEEQIIQYRNDTNSRGNNPLREEFKNFYKSKEIQQLLLKASSNPFRYWVKNNKIETIPFIELLKDAIKYILKSRKVPDEIISSALKDL